MFVAATAIYFREGHPWWLYVLLALAPDLAMLGYTAGARVGAAVYDTVHTYVLPLALGAVGVLASATGLQAVCLIWIAHIGIDRAVGYGLKYPSGFKDTHLQRI